MEVKIDDEQVAGLCQALSGGRGGIGEMLEGVAMALAGEGLNAPVGEGLAALSSSVDGLATEVREGCLEIAMAIEKLADAGSAAAPHTTGQAPWDDAVAAAMEESDPSAAAPRPAQGGTQ